MQKTFKEHYVPQFYLRNFADEKGLLHIYDFKRNKYFTQSPKNICYENNLYETKWENANPKLGEFVLPNHIEKTFCEYEGEFSKVLTKILKVCCPSQNPNALILQGNERNIFFQFIVNMIVRNPENMEVLALNKLEPDDTDNDEIKQIRTMLNDMEFGGADSICLAAKKKIALTVEATQSYPLDCVEEIRQLNFTFLYAQDNSFVTCDNPVCLGNNQEIIDENKTSIYFALSPKVAVIIGNYRNSQSYKNKMILIPADKVKLLNLTLIKHNNDKCLLIANSDSLFKHLCYDDREWTQ